MALTISITRMLTPYFNNHLPDFEAYANKTLQTPVTIEHVYLAWSIYQPELVFEQVLILDPTTKKPSISIRRIKLDFSIFRSLLAWQPMLDSLKISGVQFTVREEAQGGYNIGGPGVSVSDNLTGASVKANEVLEWIFSQPKLQLHEINIDFISTAGIKEPIILDNLVLKNSSDDHLLHGQAIFQQEAPTTVVLNINWHGKMNDFPHATAVIYLYLEGVSLPERFSKLNWHGWQIKQGLGSAKIWVEWKENALQSVQSKFQAYDLILASPTSQQSREIPRLSGNANWKWDGANQVIEGTDILIDLPQHLLPTLDFSVILAPNKANQWKVKTVKMNYLNLADTVDLLNVSHLLPDNVSTAFRTLNLHGELENFSIDLPIDDPINKQNCVISVFLNNMAFNAWNNYPGVKNLTGKLNWDGKQGGFQLNSTNLQINYPQIFQNPLHFNSIAGQLTLNNLQDDIWALIANNLQLVNQDVNVKSSFEINLVPKTSPVVNITADFSVANARNLINYLPQSILSASLNSWLKQAFLSGQINEGKVEVQGSLKDYPFAANNGKFLISSKVKNLEFSFAPGWPLMHKMNGQLTFAGSTMTADADSGFFYDVPLKTVHATLTNIGVADPSLLMAQGLINSDLAKGLYFLHHSPLEKSVGGSLSEVSLQGPMELSLDLTIPLAKPADTMVKGQINTSNAILSIPAWNLALEKMSGHFQFSENGIDAKDIPLRILGQDAKLNLSTQLSPDKKSFVRAKVQSQVQVSALEKWLGLSLSKVVTGTTAYEAVLDLAPHGSSLPTHVTLQSDFKGIVINAPVPYNKAVNTATNFKLELFLNDDQPIKSKIVYGDLATAALTLDREKNKALEFYSGEIHLGKGDASWSETPGLTITGQVDQFDWDTWKNYIDSLNLNKPSPVKPISAANNWWRNINVLVNHLTIMGQELDQVRIQLSQLNNALQIGLINQDMSGKIILPANGSITSIQATFDRLYFSSALKGSASKIDPGALPSISFIGNDVRYGNTRLGRVAFNTSPSKSGLIINNLSMDSAVEKLTAQGDWALSGNTYETSIHGSIDTDHVSELLTEWGFAESNLVASKGNVKFNLDWSDAPYSPAPGEMSGDVSLKLGEGQIINLSGVSNAKLGFGRMLSILSLQTLPRRLSLNFSDLTEKGYSFDYITANFTLSDGNAYTKDLTVNGTVARVDIAGRIGLKDKDYDLVMSITPYVTSSLPIVATIATGFNPIAGVATWLIDKAVSQSVSNVTTYHYTVTGPWSKPKWQESGSKK